MVISIPHKIFEDYNELIQCVNHLEKHNTVKIFGFTRMFQFIVYLQKYNK